MVFFVNKTGIEFYFFLVFFINDKIKKTKYQISG